MARLDRRGGTAVEFALVALPLLALIMLLLEVGWQAATEIALEHGVHDAIRFALTGQSTVAGVAGAPGCRANTIGWLVTRGATGLLAANNLQISSSTNGGASVNASDKTFGGSASSTVNYSFVYDQPYIEPIARKVMKGASMRHTITMTVQNEPYPNTPC